MGRYRKIDVRIWNDAKFRDMSIQGQHVFLFLLTHPHLNQLGAMRTTIPGLAAELGVSEKAFREAFREPLSKGLTEFDERACLFSIPNFLRYNGPESPNVVRSWRTLPDLLPECPLKIRILSRSKGYAEALGKAFGEAFREAFPDPLSKGMANQEQEQEQEQEQKQLPLPSDDGSDPAGVSAAGSETPHPEPKPKASRYTAEFERAWAAYPNHAGPKLKAFEVWKRRKLPKHELHVDEMLDAMQAQVAWKAYCDRNGQFCAEFPYFQKWLNEERWTTTVPKAPKDEDPDGYTSNVPQLAL